jgi:hypothetical protein
LLKEIQINAGVVEVVTAATLEIGAAANPLRALEGAGRRELEDAGHREVGGAGRWAWQPACRRRRLFFPATAAAAPADFSSLQ